METIFHNNNEYIAEDGRVLMIKSRTNATAKIRELRKISILVVAVPMAGDNFAFRILQRGEIKEVVEAAILAEHKTRQQTIRELMDRCVRDGNAGLGVGSGSQASITCQPADETRPNKMAMNALSVFTKDTRIREFLAENDPKALEQAEKAITALTNI